MYNAQDYDKGAMELQGVKYFGAIAGRLGYLFRRVNVIDESVDGEMLINQGIEKKGERIAVKVVPLNRFNKSSEGHISIQVTDKMLNSWNNYGHPVILVAYSTTDNGETYWERVDTAHSTTIEISLENKFDNKCSGELFRIIFSYYSSLGVGIKTAPFTEVLMELGHTMKEVVDPLKETYLEAEAMMENMDYNSAKTVYQSLSIIYKKVSAFKLNYAISLYYSEDYDECIKLCNDLMNDYNHNPKLNSLIGNCYAKLGNFDAAEKHLDNSVKLLPLSGEVWNSLGLLYFWQGKYDKANESLRVALKHDQYNPYINFTMALCCTALGKNNEAMELYEKCIKLNPKSYDSYNNKALLLKGNWKLSEAIDYFEKAIEINPDNHHAIFNLAYLLKDMGNNERALHYYKMGIELVKDAEKAYYDIACLYCRNKELDKAAGYFNKAYNYVKYDVPREKFEGIAEIIDTEYEALYLIKIEYSEDKARIIEVTSDRKLSFFNMNAFMKDCMKSLNDKKDALKEEQDYDDYRDQVGLDKVIDIRAR